MVAYSFQQRFAAPILAITKRQTVRADRKRHAREGEALQLYTGMRTRQCRLIGTATCFEVLRIRLDFEKQSYALARDDGAWLAFSRPALLHAFAKYDGFASWADLTSFWREQHGAIGSFEGVLIRWHKFSGRGAHG